MRPILSVGKTSRILVDFRHYVRNEESRMIQHVSDNCFKEKALSHLDIIYKKTSQNG